MVSDKNTKRFENIKRFALEIYCKFVNINEREDKTTAEN
jgi:hypothetical protein